jgi:hypothetical protein
MAVPLNPAPASLGLASPELGPWFTTDITLAAPNADLSVSITFAGANNWLPPAGGILSLFISSASRPAGIAGLRDGAGSPAFANDKAIALFRLLPEVEERLAALQAAIPSPDGAGAATVSTRARVRYFALEMDDTPPTIALLTPRLDFTPDGATDAQKAGNLGLVLSGGSLTSGSKPMTDIIRPGIFAGAQEKILKFGGAENVKLWAFDARGRAIDPGAVAAWWSFLATVSFNNLWASGITGPDQRTSAVAPQLTIHLVNAHEGALADPLLSRLSPSNIAGTGVVRSRDTGAGAASFTFTAPPNPDDAPVPKLALLPHGTYADTLNLWPTGPVDASLGRDYARVGVIDVERHLVGQARVAAGGATTAETRRAADQNRDTTRVSVARAAGGQVILRGTIDEAIDAFMDLFAGTDPVMMVGSVLDCDWGPLQASLPSATLPDSLPALTVSALSGSGTVAGPTVSNQRVLVEGTFDAGLAGCWVRAWSQGFDFDKGVHTSLDGGGGTIRSDGTVSLVALLPDGENAARPLGLNVLVASQNAAQIYEEVRFDRPLALGGTPIAFGATTGQIVACELGQEFASSAAASGQIPPGASLVAREGGGPALVDRTTIPNAAFVSATAIRQLAAGDRLDLTQPAYRDEPDGASAAGLGASGATVTRTARSGLTRLTAAGQPLPTQERLEVAAAQVSGTGAGAALGAAPGLARYHELLPHQSGHPGAPAAAEHHGAGIFLDGPAAVRLAEHLRDRVNAATPDLATAAGTPFAAQTEPTGARVWAASLKTVAAGTEGEVNLAPLVRSDNYPFGDTFANVKSWYNGAPRLIAVPDVPGPGQDSARRALDRRALAAGYGCREAATSLKAAFARAEDLIYIETPVLDNSSFGEAGDTLSVWQALLDRLDANKVLRVAVCVPIQPFFGCPPSLKTVRDAKLLEAAQTLGSGSRGARSVIFSPSAGPRRNLRLSSTTVIVDDVYCLTGTTHLWRRGLSFDSSLAVAVFDEHLTNGRSQQVRRFRRALLAGRLGLAETLVPDDAAELVGSLQLLVARGSIRLTTDVIRQPSPVPTATDNDIWNRDGSAQVGFNPVQWIIDLAAAAALSPVVTP